MAGSAPLVFGEAIPPPVNEVTKLGLHHGLLAAARSRRLMSPLPLQKHLWPVVIRGRSVICVSKQKSGKTMGYLIPLLSCVLETDQSKSEKANEYGPIAVVLVSSPQVAERLGKICKLLMSSITDVTCVVLHSEISECESYSQLLNGCSILISTPQAFLRALLVPHSHRYVFTNLRRIAHLIIDEADSLLSKCNESITKLLNEIASAMAVRQVEGKPAAGVQFVVVASQLTAEVQEFYESIKDYQPILIKGAGCKDEKK